MTKISELTAVTTAALTDTIPIVQDATTKRATMQQYIDVAYPGNVFRGFFVQRTSIEADESVTIPAGHQMVIVGDFIVDGELISVGDLVILD